MAEKKIVKCGKCGSPYDVSAYPQGITFTCQKCQAPVEYKPGPPASPPETKPPAQEKEGASAAGEAGMESEFLIVEEDDSLLGASGEGEGAPGAPGSAPDSPSASAPGEGGQDKEEADVAAEGPAAPAGEGEGIPGTMIEEEEKKEEKDAGSASRTAETVWEVSESEDGGSAEGAASKAPPAEAEGPQTGSRFTAMEEFERSRKGEPGEKVKRFGDFRVIGELGRGAMGVVYEAVQEPLGRHVALKVMLPSFTSSPEAVERFLRESKSTAKLKHENIVPVYGMGEQEGTYYYAMGFIEGDSLKDALKDDVMPHKERAAILRDSCRALDYAHDQGIVHRDIKPANIMIDKDKKVLITDFGIAKSEEQSTLTASGQVLGTPMYMSPEQAEGGSSQVDRRSDIYSLGATLYEAITLARPYHGEDVRSIIRNVIETEPMPPRKIDPKIPKDLETICLKAMEKAPTKRYETAGDMAEDLDRYIQGEPIKAKPIGFVKRLGRKARKNKLATVMILLVLALVTGGGAFLGYTWYDRQQQIEQGLSDAKAVFAEGEEDPDKYLEAKDAYAKVLAIDAGNTAAKEGIEKCNLMIKDLERKKTEAKVRKALAEAAEAFKAEKYKGARDLYGGVLTLDADNAAAKEGIEKCDLKIAQLEEARRRQEMEARIQAKLDEASAAYKAEKFDQARGLYQGVLTLDAGNTAAKEGIEKCDLKIAQLEEARRRREMKAKIQAKLDEASTAFKDENYEKARKIYGQILLIDETNDAARLGIENCDQAIRKLKEEKEKYERMQRGKALTAEGEKTLKEGRERVAKAEATFADADPAETRARVDEALSILETASGKFTEALKLYPGYAAARRGRVDANLARARASILAEDYAKALGFLLAAREAGADEFASDRWKQLHRTVLGTGTLTLATDPMGAAIRLETVVEDPASREKPETLGVSPLSGVDIAMGNYVLHVEKEGFEPVVYPLMVERNEAVEVSVRLLEASDVPEGMVYVPGGPFRKGDRYSGFEKAAVEGFLIDRTEVSHEAYHEFILSIEDRAEQMKRLPRTTERGPVQVFWKPESFEKFQRAFGRNLPVWGITREDAMAYAAWKGKRLPTAEEWQKAARGVDGRLWPWGNTFEPDRCNFFGRRQTIAIEPVNAYEQWTSPYGLLNMAGNVAEWSATDGPTITARGRKVKQAVVCGGSAPESKYEVMTDAVKYYKPLLISRGIGFRCARDLPME